VNTATTLARQVNDILTSYVRVHDAVFRFSLRKLLPVPGLFAAIKYCEHEKSSDDLSTILAGLQTEITAATNEPAGPEHLFLVALSEYAVALQETICQFQNICHQLCRKSQGESGYSKQLYKADAKAYDQSIQRYTELGQRLNELYAAMRGAG
jgi:hypothetical protein